AAPSATVPAANRALPLIARASPSTTVLRRGHLRCYAARRRRSTNPCALRAIIRREPGTSSLTARTVGTDQRQGVIKRCLSQDDPPHAGPPSAARARRDRAVAAARA